ncbi:aminoglycoside phosphotransferase [Shewanella sp. OPT22]|nr:aminoglycoside phosphotransferase [Shewanella sp. OPT22]
MTQIIRNQILPHYLDEAVIKTAKVSAIGNGHINQTWLVETAEKQFVLQKINTHVFPSPSALMNNFRLLHQTLSRCAEVGEYRFQSIGYFNTLSGHEKVNDKDLGVWRAINFIKNSYSVDVVSTVEQAYKAARAFGHFTLNASSIEPNKLQEVIPDFHNLRQRFAQLKKAIDKDEFRRISDIQPFVNQVLAQQWLTNKVNKIEAVLPIRVCHNDTKINNLLFDNKDHQVKAVIDLDTTMAGYLMYDFGDMVRTFCSPEEEDSTNYQQIVARVDVFEAIVEGYLFEWNNIITVEERKSLWLGALSMPLMLAVRFLTDFLNGDVYFNVAHKEHNIERALNQFTLFESLVNQAEHLEAIALGSSDKG